MKWNNRAKLTATATSALLFAILLVSCSNDNNNKDSVLPTQTPPAVEEIQDDTDSNDTVDKTITDQSDEVNAEDSSSTIIVDDTIYEVNGHYIGAIDNNSIEVEVNGEALVFQLSEAFDYVISDFVEHSAVTITYTEEATADGNYTQHIIHSISNAK